MVSQKKDVLTLLRITMRGASCIEHNTQEEYQFTSQRVWGLISALPFTVQIESKLLNISELNLLIFKMETMTSHKVFACMKHVIDLKTYTYEAVN